MHRGMPHCVTALLLVSLFLPLAGCGPRTARRTDTTERKGRIIALTDTILDTGGTDTVRFGHLRSGEIALLRIWLANESARPVAIISYDRSCGCTALEFDSEPITPGDARQVSLSFDSRGERGWQLKRLDIRFAGAGKPFRLFIEADIE